MTLSAFAAGFIVCLVLEYVFLLWYFRNDP